MKIYIELLSVMLFFCFVLLFVEACTPAFVLIEEEVAGEVIEELIEYEIEKSRESN